MSEFSEVYFSLGRFAFDTSQGPIVVKEAMDKYRKIREEYGRDTSLYDRQINSTLDTFPDLDDIPRL